MKNEANIKTQLPADEFDRVMEISQNPPPPTNMMKEIIALSTEDSWTVKRKIKQ